MSKPKILNSILFLWILSGFLFYSCAQEPQQNQAAGENKIEAAGALQPAAQQKVNQETPAAEVQPATDQKANQETAVQKPAEAGATSEKTEDSSVALDSLTSSRNVTLDFKDADIRNVLRIISYKAGVNIVSTPEVMGNVTIRLTDVPWEKALETIVKTYGFGYEWLNDKVIMVSTLEKLAQTRKAEEDAAAKEPLDNQAFQLNFSKAEEIKAAVEKLLTTRGKITVEARSNTLIITDTKSNLIKIAEIVKSLDKITPQVTIEARIIETTLGSAEKLGIDWSVRAALSGSKRPTTFPWTNAVKGAGEKMFPLVQAPSSLERVTSTSDSTTGTFLTTTTTEQLFHQLAAGFPDVPTSSFLFGTLDFSQLQAVLELLSQRTDTKVLSNPRITTLNNKEAKILVGSIVPIPNYEYSKDTGTRVVSGYTEQEIGIGLTVTPNVNEQNLITLNLKPTIDQITGFTGPNNERPIISTRNAETNVMIKDGQTLVMGGLISEKKIKYKKKVPILGDIPVLDYIFSKKEDSIDRTELLIFITPHVIREADFNPEEITKLEQKLSGSTEKIKRAKEKKNKKK